MKQEITLKLTVEEIDIIFTALGERPFKEVYELIGKMNHQANQQITNHSNNTQASPLNGSSQNFPHIS